MDSARPYTTSILLLFLLLIASSCDDGLSDGPAIKGDYFPLKNNLLRHYQVSHFNPAAPEHLFFTDTTRQVIKDDTVIDGKTYTKILRYYDTTLPPDRNVKYYDIANLVRREGSRYYSMYATAYDHFETMFLDIAQSPGSSWTQYRFSDYEKTVYTIKAVNTTKNVNGKMYRNVIETEEKVFTSDNAGGYIFRRATQHFFARDAGEIYTYEEYPPEYVYVTNTKSTLLNNK